MAVSCLIYMAQWLTKESAQHNIGQDGGQLFWYTTKVQKNVGFSLTMPESFNKTCCILAD